MILFKVSTRIYLLLVAFGYVCLWVAFVTCGRRNCKLVKKIADGYDVQPDQYPPLVHLQTASKRYCSGVAIHPRLVVTAAHCINNKFIHEIYATPTYMKIKDKQLRPNVRFADKLCTHPKFNLRDDGLYEWDLGIVRLSKPFGHDLRYLSITNKTVELDQTVSVVGFGLGDPSLFAQCILAQRVECPMTEFGGRACFEPTKDPSGRRARICPGDAGGPIFALYNQLAYLVGIVSDKGSCTKIHDDSTRVFGAFDFGVASSRESFRKLADECLADCN